MSALKIISVYHVCTTFTLPLSTTSVLAAQEWSSYECPCYFLKTSRSIQAILVEGQLLHMGLRSYRARLFSCNYGTGAKGSAPGALGPVRQVHLSVAAV